MHNQSGYKYLEPRTGSRFRQLFVKGKKFRAETLYRETVGVEPRMPEEVADDFDVPLQAVLEAIDYCTKNEEFLRQERKEELARIRKHEKKHPPLLPPQLSA